MADSMARIVLGALMQMRKHIIIYTQFVARH